MWGRVVAAVLVIVGVLALAGCGRSPAPGGGGQRSGGRSAPPPRTGPDVLTLVFAYGSEKKLWVDEAVGAFNAAGARTASGKVIQVDARAMGSGELVDEVLAGRLKAHIISPASGAFVTLGNARSRAERGADLVDATQPLLLSPVVIAMWKPMAEKLGWPGRPIGWSDVLDLARTPEGWAARGAPQWGRFRFGHTHPEYSNSGLISVTAEVYAAAGKTANLTLEDLARPEVRTAVGDIERAVVHYGESTGFFGRKMFENGPQYLSAAVLYENMVIESAGGVGGAPAASLPFPVVAVYPKEGTFWSDHPAGVIQREWVTEEHKEAARRFLDFLLERPRQERAMALGFRPADVAIPLGAPIDAAHGADPAQPKTILQTPPADVIGAVVDAWRAVKKKSSVVLVLDTSGSMKEEDRLVNAKAGAGELLGMLGDDDVFSLLTFNNRLTWAQEGTPLSQGRARAQQQLAGLFPAGGTALYDAVLEAWKRLDGAERGSAEGEKITAIVVLTDGADTDSRTSLDSLLTQVKANLESRPVRIFTIGYGRGANMKVLQSIADATGGKAYEGKAENIRRIFKEIATFF